MLHLFLLSAWVDVSRRIFVLKRFAAAFWKRVESRIGLFAGYNLCRTMHGLVSIRLNNDRMGGRRIQHFAGTRLSDRNNAAAEPLVCALFRFQIGKFGERWGAPPRGRAAHLSGNFSSGQG